MINYNIIELKGCKSDPLINYLKALGVFRIICKQKDKEARCLWKDNILVIKTILNDKEIEDFFYKEYKPTPIVVPWSSSKGSDFIISLEALNSIKEKDKNIIKVFYKNKSDRLKHYREAIESCIRTLNELGINSKLDAGEKYKFLAILRSKAPDEVVNWIDSCLLLKGKEYSFFRLLGTGGGSEGRAHFSNNFMENLMDVLPEFNVKEEESKGYLRNALFGENIKGLIKYRSVSLYDSGLAGGANTGQGMKREPFANPWDFILCLEGTLVFSGAITRRHEAAVSSDAVFPFQVKFNPSTSFSGVDNEVIKGIEIWLPIWSKYWSIGEIEFLFREGRATIGKRQARDGLDFARAVSELGVDRGIESFQRYAIIKGRIGKDYLSSANLGRVEVTCRDEIHLLHEINHWINNLRDKRNDFPTWYRSALKALEKAIFNYCIYGGRNNLIKVLCSIGNMEHELSKHAIQSRKNGEERYPNPLKSLSIEWIEATNDNSIEYEIALALSSIKSKEIGSIRMNMEPIEEFKWKDSKLNVWKSNDLVENLINILDRLLLEGKRECISELPIYSLINASLEGVASFISGDVDDDKIKALLWGLILVNKDKVEQLGLDRGGKDLSYIPSIYCLLKLLFNPYEIEDGVLVKSEYSIINLLKSGNIGGAAKVAAQRLRSSGLIPMPSSIVRRSEWQDIVNIDSKRLLASLLIPISKEDTYLLKDLILREKENKK